MRNQILTLPTLLALVGPIAGQSTVGFGPYFSLGPTSSWIREATTTLVLPEVPEPALDRLALWPGMGTSGGDLIQALAVSFSDPNANCGASAGQWCTWASTLQGKRFHVPVREHSELMKLGTQLGGEQVPASPGDKLTMSYKYNDDTGEYDQTVAINGEVVSSLSTSSGQAEGWGTAVECQDDACQSTAGAHQYVSTTITLDSADSSFGGTLAINEADSSGLTSSDDIIWTVETININAHTFAL